MTKGVKERVLSDEDANTLSMSSSGFNFTVQEREIDGIIWAMLRAPSDAERKAEKERAKAAAKEAAAKVSSPKLRRQLSRKLSKKLISTSVTKKKAVGTCATHYSLVKPRVEVPLPPPPLPSIIRCGYCGMVR